MQLHVPSQHKNQINTLMCSKLTEKTSELTSHLRCSFLPKSRSLFWQNAHLRYDVILMSLLLNMNWIYYFLLTITSFWCYNY